MKKWRPATITKPKTRRRASVAAYYEEVVVPPFSITGLPWLGASFITKQFTYSLPNDFSFKLPIVPPIPTNFILAVSYINDNNKVTRFRLWQHYSEELAYPLYQGEIIKKNFTLEVWTVFNSNTTSLDETYKLETSLLWLDGELCCDPPTNEEIANEDPSGGDENLFEEFPWEPDAEDGEPETGGGGGFGDPPFDDPDAIPEPTPESENRIVDFFLDCNTSDQAGEWGIFSPNGDDNDYHWVIQMSLRAGTEIKKIRIDITDEFGNTTTEAWDTLDNAWWPLVLFNGANSSKLFSKYKYFLGNLGADFYLHAYGQTRLDVEDIGEHFMLTVELADGSKLQKIIFGECKNYY